MSVGDDLLDIEPKASQVIDKVGWGKFFRRFDGHNTEVTRRFVLSLKENLAQIGDLTMVISEGFIAKVTQLPQTREKWFKRGEIDKAKWKKFLLPLPANYDDKFEFSKKFLKPQWLPLLENHQVYNMRRLLLLCRFLSSEIVNGV